MIQKILVIEDKAELITCFQAKWFHTIDAENGLVGIEKAKEHIPDLIICNIMMPPINGYDVLTRLRQDSLTKVIPFILIADKATYTDIRKAMDLGADDCLTKPCSIEELIRASTAQLKKQTARQQWYKAQFQVASVLFPADSARLTVAESTSSYDSLVTEIFKFIKANYYKSIGLNEVAQAFNYSPSYLTGLVRHQTGQTINDWIIKYRIRAAQYLLMKTNLPINQIAEVVGYQNIVHFFRQFRQYHGTTPKNWRKSIKLQGKREEIEGDVIGELRLSTDLQRFASKYGTIKHCKSR